MAPSVHIARQNAILKITGRITRNVPAVPETAFLFLAPSRRTTICACPKALALSLPLCFHTSLLLSSPAGWRGARRWFRSCPLRKESSAAVLVFLLMAAPPATRSGPPAGVLAGVPERRPCSYRLSEILNYGRFFPFRCATAVATGAGFLESSSLEEAPIPARHAE